MREIKKISNTNRGKNNPQSVVRIYDQDNVRIGEVEISRNNPLKYMHDHRNSVYWSMLFEQIMPYGITAEYMLERFEQEFKKRKYC